MDRNCPNLPGAKLKLPEAALYVSWQTFMALERRRRAWAREEGQKLHALLSYVVRLSRRSSWSKSMKLTELKDPITNGVLVRVAGQVYDRGP
eukprot:15457824-Alexandrium_andersonii.AAC.4